MLILVWQAMNRNLKTYAHSEYVQVDFFHLTNFTKAQEMLIINKNVSRKWKSPDIYIKDFWKHIWIVERNESLKNSEYAANHTSRYRKIVVESQVTLNCRSSVQLQSPIGYWNKCKKNSWY